MIKHHGKADLADSMRVGDRELPSIAEYYSATQLRADRWSALREVAEGLAMHGAESRKGKALLKEDILERVNDVLDTGSVRSVLFTEFVVQ